MAHQRKTDEQHQRLAQLLADGSMPIKQALMEAGWSEKQARKGRSAIPAKVYELLLERGVHYEHIGRTLLNDPQRVEARVLGFLDDAMLRRSNKGVAAARLLGQHRKVNAFAHEMQNNVLVIQAPADWKPQPLPKWDDTPLPPVKDQPFPEYE